MSVKNLKQLKARLQELGVLEEAEKRLRNDQTMRFAGLYLDLIEELHRFFTDVPQSSSCISPNRSVVTEALKFKPFNIGPVEFVYRIPATTDPALWAPLCFQKLGLREYLLHDYDVKDPTIKIAEVLPDGKCWDELRIRFFRSCAATQTMQWSMKKVVDNFCNNVAECCARVISDWKLIHEVFFPESKLNQLTNIRATNSDPHKGGRRVLILTFDHNKELVYKPSDVEADCLLIGDSQALKKSGDPDLKNFFTLKSGGNETSSLMEIINSAAALSKNKQKLIGLPTYKILPRNPGSGRNAYGYIEFLSHDKDDFEIQNENDRETFWGLFGQIAAIALRFNLTDLHNENVIAHDRKPYLIDLEASFTAPISDLSDSALTGKNGGTLPNNNEKNNLLKTANGQQEGPQVGTNWKYMFKYFKLSIELWQDREIDRKFDSWFERLTSVVVRAVPVNTGDLLIPLVAAKPSYAEGDKFSGYEDALTTRCTELFQNQLKVWQAGRSADPVKGGWWTFEVPPLMCAVTVDHVKEDYMNLDVPYFHHSLGTQTIVDSRDHEVKADFVMSGLDKIVVGSGSYFMCTPLNELRLKQSHDLWHMNSERILIEFLEQAKPSVEQHKFKIKSLMNCLGIT